MSELTALSELIDEVGSSSKTLLLVNVTDTAVDP